MNPRAAELITKLQLQPHPEGGFYRELFRSEIFVQPVDDRSRRAAVTTIYFLLTADDVSRWHQVSSDEVWHLYEGGPLELIEFESSARELTRHLLAPVDDANQAPVHVVAAGRWQAARTLGPYALMGCSVAPGFEFADFRLLENDATTAEIVRANWPELASLI
jgi:predicted cupin superfamily sugar epimerase